MFTTFRRCLWLLAFIISTCMFRLLAYTLLLVHLCYFFIPACLVLFTSLILHALLRGCSDRFYVPTSKMDVLLTASCCALVPTPVDSHVRAHNLLQVHTVLTNLLLLVMLLLTVFLNLDYDLPIVWRDEAVQYSKIRILQCYNDADVFFTLVLVTSLLVPLSAFFYAVFKWDSRLPDIPRVTIFWRNQLITPLAVATTLTTGGTILILALLTILGRMSSRHCVPSLSHGSFVPNPRGARLSCHPLYKASMEHNVTCGWFFGPEGVVDIAPLYHLHTHHASHLTSLNNLSCTFQLEADCPSLSTCPTCNATELVKSEVARGQWICRGTLCTLLCEPGFSSSHPLPVDCQPDLPWPLTHHCAMVALALPVNSTHLTPASSLTCARPRLRKASGVFLCVNPEDMLVDGACLQLKEGGLPHLHRETAFSRKFWEEVQRTSNLSLQIASLISQPPPSEQYWDGACVLQFDYNVLFFSGRTTYLSVRVNEKDYLRIPLPAPSVRRRGAACVLLPDSRILLAGGSHFITKDPLIKTEMLNLLSRDHGWKEGAPLPGSLPKASFIKASFITVEGGCIMLVSQNGTIPPLEFYPFERKVYLSWREATLKNFPQILSEGGQDLPPSGITWATVVCEETPLCKNVTSAEMKRPADHQACAALKDEAVIDYNEWVHPALHASPSFLPVEDFVDPSSKQPATLATSLTSTSAAPQPPSYSILSPPSVLSQTKPVAPETSTLSSSASAAEMKR